jgi:eukaryotic-like serine/threonine-protein kinase
MRRDLVGRQVGTFNFLSRLGAGGMGEVYRARDNRLGRDVALKVLNAEVADDPARRVRFEREARVLASLSHTNIAGIHSVENIDGQPALVLELVEGATLEERLRSGPVPVAEAFAIGHQIADAVTAAHGKGIIHRDLKPANVKLTGDGVVKVLDFGLAKALAEGDEVSTSPTVTGLTHHGTIPGLLISAWSVIDTSPLVSWLSQVQRLQTA